jgi:alanine racemase
MKTSRREFVKLAAAVPAIGVTPVTDAGHAAGPDSSFDPWVEVHSGNLRHNVEEIRRRVASRPILAVIKNNGYGAGVANVARVLEPLDAVAGFAVVKLHEATTLRDSGVRKPVVLMGPCDEQNLADAVARDIVPMVYTPLGPVLEQVAARHQKAVPIHICVDTGIGRVGVPYRDAAALVRDLAGRRAIRIEGTMMTFTEDEEFDKEQLKRFRELTASLEREGVALGRKHAASSFALFQRPEGFLDMVRPGMAIYGAYSEAPFRSAGVMDLRPAVSLKTRVAYVKQLRAGESAGYNRAYIARQNVWLATLPVGHADGLPRVAAKGGRVRIGAASYPIVASVSASHCIVELGAEPRVQIGDVATLFDDQEGSRPDDLAAACGSSVYDLMMHLNPLLPRRLL